MSELSDKFFKGVTKILAKAGFDAVIERTELGGFDPDDPLGPPVETVTQYPARVFVDRPKTRYIEGALVTQGDGTLYVDLNSPGLTVEPKDGDYLVYANGKRQMLSDTETPAVNGITVITMSVVTGVPK